MRDSVFGNGQVWSGVLEMANHHGSVPSNEPFGGVSQRGVSGLSEKTASSPESSGNGVERLNGVANSEKRDFWPFRIKGVAAHIFVYDPTVWSAILCTAKPLKTNKTSF